METPKVPNPCCEFLSVIAITTTIKKPAWLARQVSSFGVQGVEKEVFEEGGPMDEENADVAEVGEEGEEMLYLGGSLHGWEGIKSKIIGNWGEGG